MSEQKTETWVRVLFWLLCLPGVAVVLIYAAATLMLTPLGGASLPEAQAYLWLIPASTLLMQLYILAKSMRMILSDDAGGLKPFYILLGGSVLVLFLFLGGCALNLDALMRH